MKRMLLLLVPFMLLLTACLDTAYTGNATGKKVGLPGDSITVNSRNALHTILEPDYQVRADAVIGETSYQTVGDPPNVITVNSVNTIAATNPDIAVINLGTNVTTTDTAQQISAQLDLLRNKFVAPTCVYFVTLSVQGTGGFAFANGLRSDVNDHLRVAGPVVEWSNTIAADPTLVGVDGIHPTSTGQLVYAQLIKDAIAAC